MKYQIEDQSHEYHARVYFQKNHDYRHIYIDFYTLDERNNKQFSHDLSNFQISCQTDQGTIEEKGNETYAWRLETKHNVVISDYKEMTKIFSEIERKYNKLSENFGMPENFGEYATYMLNAIGIKYFTLLDETYERKTSDLRMVINNHLNQIKQSWY